MKFINFTYLGRTIKCVALSYNNETVYCLFPLYKHLVHNPSLKWDIVERVNPKDEKTYKFIKIFK